MWIYTIDTIKPSTITPESLVTVISCLPTDLPCPQDSSLNLMYHLSPSIFTSWSHGFLDESRKIRVLVNNTLTQFTGQQGEKSSSEHMVLGRVEQWICGQDDLAKIMPCYGPVVVEQLWLTVFHSPSSEPLVECGAITDRSKTIYDVCYGCWQLTYICKYIN